MNIEYSYIRMIYNMYSSNNNVVYLWSLFIIVFISLFCKDSFLKLVWKIVFLIEENKFWSRLFYITSNKTFNI